MSGNLIVADQQIDAGLKYYPNNSELYFFKGRVLQEKRKDTASLTSYSIAIFLDSKNVKAYINRGLVKGSLRDLSGALDDFNEAIRIDPRNSYAWLNRGVTLAGLNQLTAAIADFDTAIKLKPDYADAYRNRGIVKNYLGNQSGACRDWMQSTNFGDNEVREWVSTYCKAKQGTRLSNETKSSLQK